MYHFHLKKLCKKPFLALSQHLQNVVTCDADRDSTSYNAAKTYWFTCETFDLLA